MSRLRPPPAGLPPRPGGDSYRPDQNRNVRLESRDYDREERERDRDRPSMYQFGADSYRSAPRDSRSYERYGPNDRYAPGTGPPPLRPSSELYRQQNGQAPPLGEFNFRYDAPPSIATFKDDLYRPAPQQSRRNDENQQNNNGYRQGRRRGNEGQNAGRGGYRGRFGPKMASEREFLQGNREPTPELMPGMDDEDTGVRFKPMEDMSDSDEAEMDMSDDENVATEQPKKKARTIGKAADGDAVPRWSNPDPYTALPPPDESQRKKKDVVKLIRKARVETNSASAVKVNPAEDFISFDFGDETEDGQSRRPDYSQSGIGVVGAPTGPRFSHNANLHNKQPSTVLEAALSDRPLNQQVQNQVQPQSLQAHANDQNVPDRVNDQSIRAPLTNQSNRDRADRNGQPVNDENFRFDLTVSADPTLAKVNRSSKSAKIETTPNLALGSRKRNIRDEIKPAPVLHKVGKFVSKKAVDGTVLREWKPQAGGPRTPWLEIDHSDTANMGLWLHKEIMDFYNFVKPRDFEYFIRTKLVDDLRSRLKKSKYSDADLWTFGSFPAGLYLPTADMDLVCVSDEFMRTGRPLFGGRQGFYYEFGAFIKREGLAIKDSVEVIPKSKVPLVKYIDRLTGLKVDISFENTTGLTANQTFQEWRAKYPAMPILVTLVKHLLAMRGLNEPVNGGIGGFSVTCLVVSLLQNMPQVQSRDMIPEHHLGEVLMEFFDLYGNQFNTTTTAIRADRPGYLSKEQTGQGYSAHNQHRLSIIDPNNPSNDIAGGSGNTATILQCFSQSYRELQIRMSNLLSRVPAARRGESILDAIIAGNYSSFKLQREHLAHLHEKLYGPIEIE